MRRAAILMSFLVLAVSTSVMVHDYQANGLIIDHPNTRATPPGATTAAGYVTIINRDAENDRLIGADSSAAERVELHRTEVRDGVATMRPIAGGLAIPAGGAVELTSGGTHLMLIGLKGPIVEHRPVPLTLEFEKAGTVAVEMVVLPLGASAAPADAHHNH